MPLAGCEPARGQLCDVQPMVAQDSLDVEGSCPLWRKGICRYAGNHLVAGSDGVIAVGLRGDGSQAVGPVLPGTTVGRMEAHPALVDCRNRYAHAEVARLGYCGEPEQRFHRLGVETNFPETWASGRSLLAVSY